MKNIIEKAKEVLRLEAEGILRLMDTIGPSFKEAVEMIYGSEGRVILTGIGKSGIVARKIMATFNSTGTPALFLHPVEAMHGDLGMVTAKDILLVLSNSGETEEVLHILPSIKALGTRSIAFCGNLNAALAQACDLAIYVGVEREACPLGLSPTASTTAALAMGDALAVALLEKRQFNHQDFQRFHPGGSLGERLTLRVKEVMFTGNRVPVVYPELPVLEALKVMDQKDLGSVLVVDQEKVLLGILTDGDLRRMLLKKKKIASLKVGEVMSPRPKTITPDRLASEALEIMEAYLITVLPIVDRRRKVKGILHLHDLLGRGRFRFSTLARETGDTS